MDNNGHRHQLNVFVDIIDAGTLSNPNAEKEGLMFIKTSDGAVVNRLEKGKYQIVVTNSILTSDEQDAP